MTPTQVGMRCPECARERQRVVRVPRAAAASSVPRVTYGLIGINVLAFLAESNQFTLSGTAGGSVVAHGILFRAAISEADQYYRLITSAFLHADLLHIGFNMYLLYLLGVMLEPAIGSLRFGAIYLTSLLAGSFGALLATNAPTLGASGAIFGLMGAAAVELRSRGMPVLRSGIGFLIIINLAFSFSVANVSVGAHVGGLIGGALAGLAIQTADRRHSLALGLGLCLAMCVAAVAASLAVSASTSPGFA